MFGTTFYRRLSLVALLAGCAAQTSGERYRQLVSELGEVSLIEYHGLEHTDPLEGVTILDRGLLVEKVLERNPSLQAARDAWREALARVPQAGSLMDPMLAYEMGPLSIANPDVRYGQVVTLRQGFPFPGKLALEEEMALAEAEAAKEELAAVRLSLAVMAAALFDEYYAVHRALDINDQHQHHIATMLEAARARYEAGKGSQQMLLAADVELAKIRRERVAIEAMRDVLAIRINALLHRSQSLSVPPPPAHVPPPDAIAETLPALLEEAAARRPELLAHRAHIRSGEAGVRRAEKERYPDFEVMASYNSMWNRLAHQLMVGVGINIPLWQGRRDAQIDEAEARLDSARAAYAHHRVEIEQEVAEALRRVREAEAVVALFEEELLPPARDRIEAARIGFEVGKETLSELIDAAHMLRTIELELEEARATLWTRRAELERALGTVPGLSKGGDQ